MRITYVNLWAGFSESNYQEECFLTDVIREIYPKCEVSLGYEMGTHYDLIFSIYRPIPSAKYFLDMRQCEHKSVCFTGESYDIVETTPNCNAYIGYDLDELHKGKNYDYLRFPLYAAYHIANLKKYGCNTFEELREKFKKTPTIPKFSAVVSNPSNSLRTSVIEKLISMGLCDSGGRTLNNVTMNMDDKISFCSHYPINIAFENLSKKSYITEKIYEAYVSGSVPFYWGASDICEEFNPSSFIPFDTSSAESANESINKAISLLTNLKELNRMKDVDPITNYRSGKYLSHGKEILKNFIMNVLETS
jgi:hypothetical protein